MLIYHKVKQNPFFILPEFDLKKKERKIKVKYNF